MYERSQASMDVVMEILLTRMLMIGGIIVGLVILLFVLAVIWKKFIR